MVHRNCNWVIKCVQLMMEQWVLGKGLFFCGEFLTLGDKMFQSFGKIFLVQIWLILLKFWEFSPHFGNPQFKKIKIKSLVLDHIIQLRERLDPHNWKETYNNWVPFSNQSHPILHPKGSWLIQPWILPRRKSWVAMESRRTVGVLSPYIQWCVSALKVQTRVGADNSLVPEY